jgi:hypothetical protein
MPQTKTARHLLHAPIPCDVDCRVGNRPLSAKKIPTRLPPDVCSVARIDWHDPGGRVNLSPVRKQRDFLVTIVSQLAPGKLSHGIDGLSQSFIIKIHVKENQV